MVRKTEKDTSKDEPEARTDAALDREREARAAGDKPGEPGEQGRARPNPGRDADRSDDEQARAEQAEKDRPRDDGGNHSRRQDAPDDPAWRGVSGDDQPDDEPDQERTLARIAEAQGTTADELRVRLTRDRGFDPDRPMVSHREAFETGFAGQVPDPTPNEAYTVGGQVTGEAAAADHRAATRGRDGDEGYELAKRVAQRRGGAAPQQPGQDEDGSDEKSDEKRHDEH
jgi:hypothetical protein